ncbi:serine racemase-like [Zingiber officinale]|uniref:serine racemase-like n=1 Tax=Zingiber officinale TaxID=94328 RepID=UPI001C4DC04F|nr:serine racemase-like [Zingiber officinale]
MDNGKQVKNDNYAADIASIREARVRIAPYIHETPVLTSKSLDSIASKRLYFKCECFQKGGAFKIRGASNAIFSLSDDQAAKGVLTHNSGNHAAAVALAAKLRGIPAYVVIPKNAPKCKVENVRWYGGQIFWSESTIQSRESITEKVQQDTGAILVHPFNNRFTISPVVSITITMKKLKGKNYALRAAIWFIKRQKRTLFEVLEKVKADKTRKFIPKLEHSFDVHELMILGFISLLLTFSQDQITKICVPKAVADSMLPCRPDAESTGRNKRRLLALVLTESHLKRRILAAGDSVVECPPMSSAQQLPIL